MENQPGLSHESPFCVLQVFVEKQKERGGHDTTWQKCEGCNRVFEKGCSETTFDQL